MAGAPPRGGRAVVRPLFARRDGRQGARRRRTASGMIQYRWMHPYMDASIYRWKTRRRAAAHRLWHDPIQMDASIHGCIHTWMHPYMDGGQGAKWRRTASGIIQHDLAQRNQGSLSRPGPCPGPCPTPRRARAHRGFSRGRAAFAAGVVAG